MRVIVLGSGGYYPNRLRHTACVLLPELGIVLDAGTGMFRLPQWAATSEFDIFLSHAHLDHVVGLTYLLGLLPGWEPRRKRVHATPKVWQAVCDHLFSAPLFPVAPTMEFQPLEAQVLLSSGAKVTSFPLEHPGGSTGFRIDHGDMSVAYVTDTSADPDAPYVSNIENVDLLIHECYFEDEQRELADRTGHSVSSKVAEVAQRCRAKQVLLMHMNSACEQPVPLDLGRFTATFANVLVGRDEMVLTL